jgi:hypothetical protein
MNAYIVLDPAGDGDIGVVLLVAAKTGVFYSNQCGGAHCLQNEMEGFLIPLGYPEAVDSLKALIDFFREDDLCTGIVKESNIPRLGKIVEKIVYWETYPPSWSEHDFTGEEKRLFLELDLERLGDLVEAWVPVKTAYGPGVLTFLNCD